MLMGDFTHLDICWEDNMASFKRSQTLLESIDNFLIQVVNRSTRGGVLLDLVLSTVEEIIKDIKIRGNLGCGHSDHTVVGFMISRNMGLAKDPEFQESELQIV